MSAFLLSAKPNKPNRLDTVAYPNKDNNKEYHLDYGNWAASNAHNHLHTKWLANTAINKRFYKGDQWNFKEDTEAFLKDDTGQTRNRIKIVHNLIRPMIEQYRGNAIRLQINASARSISKLAVNRRETALEKQLFKTDTANEFPGVGAVMREQDKTIGRTRGESAQIFQNLYVDDYVTQVNRLLKYVGHLNEFEAMQPKMAQNLGLSGLVVNEAFHHGGHQRYETIESEDFFWDRNARKYDLTDSSYMGTVTPMDPSMILEKWQDITHDERKAMEDFVSQEASHMQTDLSSTHGRPYYGSRLPVFKVYWKDIDKFEYGWVNDEYGYPWLVKINFTEPGETEPRFTEKDLIDPPETVINKRLFKSKKTRNLYVDVLRFCTFVPGEVVGQRSNKTSGEKTADIALDWGLSAYQETDYLDVSNVKYPFKCMTWGYVDGEVFSPVDDAINPQRFINRVLSATESQINNSGGSNVVIDEDALPNQDKGQAYHDINQGKPLTLRTKGRGVPNAISTYDATPKAGTYAMFELIPLMKNLIQDTSGVNEGLKGESTGPDQLVGVTELLIQRGSLMQEPFYNAIARVFVQMHQHTATVGKRMYIDNERELAIAIGDDGVDVIKLAKGLKNEDFRVFVERENADAILMNQANQMLTLFLQLGMIDEFIFTNLYNRSTPHEVTKSLRDTMGLKQEDQRKQAQEAQAAAAQQQQQEANLIASAQQQDQVNNRIARSEKLQDRQQDIDKIMAKGIVDISKERTKNKAA